MRGLPAFRCEVFEIAEHAKTSVPNPLALYVCVSIVAVTLADHPTKEGTGPSDNGDIQRFAATVTTPADAIHLPQHTIYTNAASIGDNSRQTEPEIGVGTAIGICSLRKMYMTTQVMTERSALAAASDRYRYVDKVKPVPVIDLTMVNFDDDRLSRGNLNKGLSVVDSYKLLKEERYVQFY
ncbi:hypothetical protein Tco_0390621 [Tanacetum coccineum]